MIIICSSTFCYTLGPINRDAIKEAPNRLLKRVAIALGYTIRAGLTIRGPIPTPSHPFPSLLLPSLPLPSSSLLSLSLPLDVGPLNLVWGSGERCELPQRGLGRSPSRNRFWCILAFKSDICWQHFLMIFPRINCPNSTPPYGSVVTLSYEL